jgi:DNA invertase Pin-like site-specific DNA recombinase
VKLGYARVSTSDQKAGMQVEALVAAGVAKDKIFIDQLSGAKSAKERPAMADLLKHARDGDELLRVAHRPVRVPGRVRA